MGCALYGVLGRFILKDFVFEGFYGPFLKLRLVNDGDDGMLHVDPWHARWWRDWGGVGLFGLMVYRDRPGEKDDAWVARTVVHEGTHCWQWLWMGLLMYVTYLLHMLFIYLFQKDKHPYLDCWAERMARRRAGQIVDIRREEWPNGPRDRWPWW